MKQNDLLLIIDMQNVYTTNQHWACTDTEGVAKRLSNLLMKRPKLNTIFTQFIASNNPIGVWKNYNLKNEKINNDKWLNEIVPQLKPFTTKYPLYSKSTYSSVTIPEVYKEAKKANRVIISGVIADCCVLSTIFSLIDEGCYVVYLIDGISGINKETEDATIITLKGLSPLHISFMSIDEYMKEN